ncbi:hypothetical protein PLICRDRAFT_30651 [Plicaturopsis crispa FD-325 SS-3]|nr:hypothetical protein PLICRDRAFT_30651 [Plicaturopsis crispa FD-325 SS-3]
MQRPRPPSSPPVSPPAASTPPRRDGSDVPGSPDGNSEPNIDPFVPPGHFDGDYYGAYEEDEMPWDDDDGQASEGSERDSSSSDDDDEEDAGWERPAPPHPASSNEEEDEDGGMSTDEDTDERVRTEQRRATAEDKLRQEPIISHFPSPRAGEPLRREASTYSQYREKVYEHNNVWAPFSSRLDWEFAQWAKTRGPGSTAVSELLEIKGIRKKLDLSYKNSRELNKIIDEKLPTRPRFERHEVVVDGEPFEMYCRDVIACVRDLYGDPEFAPYLVFVPERHYADKDKTIRMYHDMYTGKWWWSTQKKVESDKPGATIIPVIISSDKTQVTMFRNKAAYPVYLTIGNIPKEIRRKPSQYTERLHIDLAKDAYRATNHKDEYPQMTLWLERKEKILRHAKFIRWRLRRQQGPLHHRPPGVTETRQLAMTRHPSATVPIKSVIDDYGATYFRAALARFVVKTIDPSLSAAQTEHLASGVHFQSPKVDVYHRIKFCTMPEYAMDDARPVTVDSIHVQPARKNKRRKLVPGRFDTALINIGLETGGEKGVHGHRIAQVRLVFSLSETALDVLFPSDVRRPPKHLAYVEWFTPFTALPEAHYEMYKVSRVIREGQRYASIVPVEDIRSSVHLFPKFGPVAPREWTSSTVLDECPSFLASCWSDRYMYYTLY